MLQFIDLLKSGMLKWKAIVHIRPTEQFQEPNNSPEPSGMVYVTEKENNEKILVPHW